MSRPPTSITTLPQSSRFISRSGVYRSIGSVRYKGPSASSVFSISSRFVVERQDSGDSSDREKCLSCCRNPRTCPLFPPWPPICPL